MEPSWIAQGRIKTEEFAHKLAPHEIEYHEEQISGETA